VLVIPAIAAAARSTSRMLINYLICFKNHKMTPDPRPRKQRLSAHLARPTLRMINAKSNGQAGELGAHWTTEPAFFSSCNSAVSFFFGVGFKGISHGPVSQLPSCLAKGRATGMGIKMNEK